MENEGRQQRNRMGRIASGTDDDGGSEKRVSVDFERANTSDAGKKRSHLHSSRSLRNVIDVLFVWFDLTCLPFIANTSMSVAQQSENE